MSATQKYLTLCLREQWLLGSLWQCECRGDAVRLKPGSYRGAIYLAPVDSGEKGFDWNRVHLDAVVPRDGGIRAYALALDTRTAPEWPAPDAPRDPMELFERPAAADTDFLLRGKRGRFLFLALEFSAGGGESPELRAVSVRMGGDHMTDYLPGIYQGDDFTYRYLSIFNSVLRDTEDKVDHLSARISPAAADSEMLAFLAHWLCLDSYAGEEALRAELPQLLRSYETMYTPEGVRRSAKRLTGVEPTLIEHFMVDPNAPGCPNPELYRRLYGDNPYRFFILYPEEVLDGPEDVQRFVHAMQRRIPAETEMELVVLRPCIRLDWHTYLGMNSRIGGYIPAAINDNMSIRYDTIIGGEER